MPLTGRDFLNKTQKAVTTKKNINKLSDVKIMVIILPFSKDI